MASSWSGLRCRHDRRPPEALSAATTQRWRDRRGDVSAKGIPDVPYQRVLQRRSLDAEPFYLIDCNSWGVGSGNVTSGVQPSILQETAPDIAASP